MAAQSLRLDTVRHQSAFIAAATGVFEGRVGVLNTTRVYTPLGRDGTVATRIIIGQRSVSLTPTTVILQEGNVRATQFARSSSGELYST